VRVPDRVTAVFDIRPAVPAAAPDFVQRVTAKHPRKNKCAR